MRIDVVWSPAARQVEQRSVELPAGATVEQALRASGLPVAGAGVGLWGRRCSLQQPLRDGDRVEVYRPLLIDPKEARRARGRRGSAASRR
ncbi:MAG TPA: RnfH family protein [Methylibium sp.]|nr:RnfH family protein [Methylibium sp.]